MKKKSGLIRKYGLNMSRQAFREHAEAIGFKKVSAPLPAKGVLRHTRVCGGDIILMFGAVSVNFSSFDSNGREGESVRNGWEELASCSGQGIFRAS